MLKKYEGNSNFAGVVSMKWISKHIASGIRLKALNKELSSEISAKQEVKQEA
jgi:hypothetical protein